MPAQDAIPFMKLPMGRVTGRRALILLKMLGLLARRLGMTEAYLRFIQRKVRETGLFNDAWYLRHNADVADSGIDPLEHFVRYGDREGRSPVALFDPLHYRAHSTPRAPKIVNSLIHYAWLGRYSGASTSAWFDSGFYLAQNRDVKYSRMDPLLHFVTYGWHEGRPPTEDFDRMLFLRALPWFDPEAAATVSTMSLPHAEAPGEDEWAALTPLAGDGPAVVDVIVPVYRGYQETLRCIHSALSLPQKTAFELIVIHDAGPEPELAAMLARLAARGLFTYLENTENLGFVRTVNRGMRLHPSRDVVLLNADAQPYNDWLDRLRAAAYRDDRVASVTPLSNNATICSYPQFNRDNPCVIEVDGATVDALAASVNAGVSVPAPTGVGFCMYIRRAALDAVGLFDELAFGLGYGEENDFCQRAIQAGWQNRLAADTYVWHWGSTSFGGTRHKRVLHAMEVLARRYPRYQRDVDAFIGADPLRESRRRLDEARLARARGDGNVLIVTHARGGGTERHIEEVVRRLKGEGKGVYYLRPDARGAGLYSAPGLSALPNMPVVDVSNEAALRAMCVSLGISEIHVHQLVDFVDGISGALMAVAAELGLRLEIAVHDYLSICPRINLVDASGRYCGEPAEGRCNQCLAQSPPAREREVGDIVRWRARSRALFEAADQVVVPDEDVSGRLGRYFPAARFLVRPHESAPVARRLRYASLDDHDALHVVVIGAIGGIKGYEVLAACSRDARQRELPLRFTILGYSRDDNAIRAAGVNVVGKYRDEELPALLAGCDAHLVWLPSVWPETYCYTLTPALSAGLPVAAFDLGAIAGRLRAAGQADGLMPFTWAATPARINERFLQFRRELIATTEVREAGSLEAQ